MLVIGAGAAGMMCAVTAAEKGVSVTVLERNDKIGRKLYITGKGRCNVTNCSVGDDFNRNIVTNARFLYGALSRFDSYATMDFFERHGVPLKVERGNRVFPQSDRSADIVDALYHAAQRSGVRLVCNCRVQSLTFADGTYTVHTDKGEYTDADVVVATGGITYPATGSDGDGYRLAQAVGHSIVPPVGALVGLRCEGTTALSGLTLKNVRVRVQKDGATLAEEFGEMLYTHTGVSGPTILSLSSRINRIPPEGMRVVVDAKPAVDEDTLDARLERDLNANNKQLLHAVAGYLPKSMIAGWLDMAGVDARKQANSVTRAERRRLAYGLKHFVYKVDGPEPIEGAIVTAGGVAVSEVDPRTMQSKRSPGLYFVGEVLDVDALTGGFNLQLAFSTGYSAALAVAQKENKA